MAGMRNLQGRGFSLIGLVIAMAIVGILLVYALQNYQPVLTSFEKGTGDRPSFRADISKDQVRKLQQAEMMYFDIHRTFATWDQLMKDGEIARGYSNRAKGPGTPFIPFYDINIEITENGFIITAAPNFAAGAVEHSPTWKIDQDGNFQEVPE